MPRTEHMVLAAALGVLGGAMVALWVTVAEAEGLGGAPSPAAAPRARAAGATCAPRLSARADSSAPRPTEASKPVVDGEAARCP